MRVAGNLRWTLVVNPASGNMVGSVSNSRFRTMILLLNRTAGGPHLHSHSGYNAGAALARAPTAPRHTIPPHLFRTLILESCHAPLDPFGRHRKSCIRSGRIKKRATLPLSAQWRAFSAKQELSTHEHQRCRTGFQEDLGASKICLAWSAVGGGHYFTQPAVEKHTWTE